MLTSRRRLLFVNTFGLLAYGTIILEWLWGLLPYLPSLLHANIFKIIQPDNAMTVNLPLPRFPAPLAGIYIALAVIVVVIAIFITVVALRRLPRAIGESGKKLTASAAEAMAPLIFHAPKMSPKKQRILSERLRLYVKLALLAIPLFIALFAPSLNERMSHDLFVFVAALLAGWTLILFCIQLIAASLLKVRRSRLW